jgi:nucleotide-binding universal stress UspA family protein
MNLEEIALAMPIEEKLLHPLYDWGAKMDWRNLKHVHLVHVVKRSIAPFEFGVVEIPDEKTYETMKTTLQKYLRDEAKKIFSNDFKGEVSVHLSIHSHPEDEMVNILKHINSRLVVVATEGKHGLEGFFHNSFTDHLVRFAPCDVYVVRPVK